MPGRAELIGPGEIFLGFEFYLLGREAVPGIAPPRMSKRRAIGRLLRRCGAGGGAVAAACASKTSGKPKDRHLWRRDRRRSGVSGQKGSGGEEFGDQIEHMVEIERLGHERDRRVRLGQHGAHQDHGDGEGGMLLYMRDQLDTV